MAKQTGSSAKPKETFPKIKTDCKIVSCKKVKGGVDLRFDDLAISGSQFEQVSDWIDDAAELTISLQLKQGSLLPPENAKSETMQETVERTQ